MTPLYSPHLGPLSRHRRSPSRHVAARTSGLIALVIALGGCASGVSRVDLPAVSPEPTGVHHVGQFVWHDLVTDDMEGAKGFYGQLFGWQFEDIEGEGIVYSVIMHEGVAIGGIAPIDDEDINVSSARWLSLMSVADVDQATDVVLRAGGSVAMEPWDNPTRGRLAVVSDPEGALVAFVRSRDGDPPNRDEADLVSGRWMWTELWARDASAAVSLYQSVAGYGVESTEIAQSAEYRVLTSDGRPRAGVNQLPWPEVQPNWLPYIKVDDPARIARRAAELGGTVLIPPLANVREGSVGLLIDPSGAAFAIQRWPISGGNMGGVR